MMLLKELKNSLLSKFSSDFDDAHVVLQVQDEKGETQVHLLAGVGMTTSMNAIILVSEEEVKRMRNEGKIPDSIWNQSRKENPSKDD